MTMLDGNTAALDKYEREQAEADKRPVTFDEVQTDLQTWPPKLWQHDESMRVTEQFTELRDVIVNTCARQYYDECELGRQIKEIFNECIEDVIS